MMSSKKLDNILKSFKENLNKEFSGDRDKRVNEIISYQFSLNDFHGITFEQSQLERDAAAGDAFSLAMLGKISYDNGNITRAFAYFDAATEKGNKFLVNAVASYLNPRKEAWKYHRLAISKGDNRSSDYLRQSSAGGYHALIEEMTRTKDRDPSNWEYFHSSHVKEFREYATQHPSEFKSLCMECSFKKVQNALNDEKLAERYLKKFKNELADEILTACASRKYSKMTQEQVIEQISAKYHKDYSDNITEVIAQREKQIEDASVNILQELEGTVLSQVKELLSSMRMHLQLEAEDQLDEEKLTEKEQNLLRNILRCGSDNTAEEDMAEEGFPKQEMEKLLKNNPDFRSIFLQLQAFVEVNKKLDIPSITAAHETHLYDQVLPKEGEEEKFPNTEKLRQIAEIIENNNKKLLTEAKSIAPPAGWSKFMRIFLAACTVIGIGLMIHSSYVYGTHKFWKPKAEKEKSNEERVSRQAADKAQGSLFKPLTRHADRAANELPVLKATRKK